MNIAFVQIVKMGPLNRYFETRCVPYSIDGKGAVWIREEVDLRQGLGVAFATEWPIGYIQRLPFKTLPGRSQVLALVRQRLSGRVVSIERMVSLRGLPVPLLVWWVIEHWWIGRWVRVLVLVLRWTERVWCEELWSKRWVTMRATTISKFTVLNSIAKCAPAPAPTVAT